MKDYHNLEEVAIKYDKVFDPLRSEFSRDLKNLFEMAYKQGYEEGLNVAKKNIARILEDMKEGE